MATGESAGTVFVTITGDASTMGPLFSQVASQAKAAGAQVAQSFQQAAAQTEPFTVAINRLAGILRDEGAAAREASAQTNSLIANLGRGATGASNFGTAAQRSGFSVRYLFLGIKDIAEGRGTFALAELANELLRLGPVALAAGGALALIGGTAYGLGRLHDEMAGLVPPTKEEAEEMARLSHEWDNLKNKIQTLDTQAFEKAFGKVAGAAHQAAAEVNNTATAANTLRVVGQIQEVQKALDEAKAGIADNTDPENILVLAPIISAQENKLKVLNQELAVLKVQKLEEGKQASAYTGTSVEGQQGDNDKRDNAAKEAARQAEEARRKEVEALKKTNAEAFDAQRTQNQLTIADEQQFWQDRLAEAQKGGAKYKEVVAEINRTLAGLQQEAFRGEESGARQIAQVEKELADEVEKYKEEKARRSIDAAKERAEKEVAITKTLREQLSAGGKGGSSLDTAITAGRAGFPTVQQQQGDIDKLKEELKLAEQVNVPIAERLKLQQEILDKQIALAAAQGQNDNADKIAAANVALRATLVQWQSLGLGNAAQNLESAVTRIPQALGGALASGIFGGGKKGEDVGKQVADALKGIGKQLLGQVFTQAIEKLIASIIIQTGLQAAFNAIFPVAQTASVVATSANTAALGFNTAAILTQIALLGFADGTDFAPGGLAVVGEKGPEIVNLPRGAQVIPNSATRSILGGRGAGTSYSSASSVYSAQSLTIGEAHFHGVQNIDDLSDAIARQLPNRLKTRLPNTSAFAN